MPGIIVALFFGLGAVLGSFANVCIWRLPRGESITWPPSHCPRCQARLKPWHLVPILSWVFLRGKCGMCGGKISVRYPVVEFITALLFAAIAYKWGLSLLTLQYCILSLALVISVATDLSNREIPDQISLGAALILAVIALITASWGNFLGGALLFAILLLIAVASKGGMGGGDIKLALAIGLGLGWKLGLVALVLAFLVGGVVAIILLFSGKRGKEVPFAPFLAAGTLIAMFWGDVIIKQYIAFSLLLWHW